MNQEMMRGAYALAVSAVTQMRLCNDTMGILGPADAGPLTEEREESSCRLGVFCGIAR